MRGCCGKREQGPDVDIPTNMRAQSPVRTAPLRQSLLAADNMTTKVQHTAIPNKTQTLGPRPRSMLNSLGILPFTRVVMDLQAYKAQHAQPTAYERVQVAPVIAKPKKKLEVQVQEEKIPLPSRSSVVKTPRPERPQSTVQASSQLKKSVETKDFKTINIQNIRNGNYLDRTPIRKKKPELLWNIRDKEVQVTADDIQAESQKPIGSESGTAKSTSAVISSKPRKQSQTRSSTAPHVQGKEPLDLGDLVLSRQFDQQPVRAKLDERKLFVALEEDLQVPHYE